MVGVGLGRFQQVGQFCDAFIKQILMVHTFYHVLYLCQLIPVSVLGQQEFICHKVGNVLHRRQTSVQGVDERPRFLIQKKGNIGTPFNIKEHSRYCSFHSLTVRLK